MQNQSALSILLTRLTGIMAQRVQTNSILLVMALATGTIAYLALIAAGWFAVEQASNEIYASLFLAGAMMVATLIIWGIKKYADYKDRQRQTIVQTQLVTALTHETVDRMLEKNKLLGPALALIGWSLLGDGDQSSNSSFRRLPK